MKPGDGVDGRVGRIPVGDHFKALARNKYWWLTLGLNFALWTYNGMAAYIAKYVLGNSNLIAVIGLATVIPMVIGLPFAGPLVARFGKRNASMAGLVLVAVGSLLVFVDPSNLWVFFVSIIVRMVGIIPMNAALNAMSGDVVEYGEWRSGVRSDGIVISSSSFSMKVAMGVSSAAIAWILGASGYDGSLAVRSDATVLRHGQHLRVGAGRHGRGYGRAALLLRPRQARRPGGRGARRPSRVAQRPLGFPWSPGMHPVGARPDLLASGCENMP